MQPAPADILVPLLQAAGEGQSVALGRWALLMALLLGVLIGFVTALLVVGRTRTHRARRAGRKRGRIATDLSVDPWAESARRTPMPNGPDGPDRPDRPDHADPTDPDGDPKDHQP